MAKIKAIYDKQGDIPDLYKDLYEEKGDKWVLTNIDGITTDANLHRVEFALTKEREQNSKLREDAKAYGKTPDEVKLLMEKLEEAEAKIEAGPKPDDTAIDKIVEARLKIKMGPLERDLAKTKKDLETSNTNGVTLASQISTGKIKDHIRKAAEKASILPAAIADVLLRASTVFEVSNLDGKERIMTRDAVGCTPGIDGDTWIEEILPHSPHWLQANQGAGANGNLGRGLGLTGPNPYTRKDWNMTEQGKLLTQFGREKSNKIAEAVGSKVGATAPPPETK